MRWDWPNVQSMRGMAGGTHDMNLIAMLQLAESLGRLPRRVTIWGIEIESSRPAAPLSPTLGPLIRRLAQSIVADISGI